MKFNLTVDKRAEAVIDGRLCVNSGRGAEDFCTFGDARIRAMESGCTASCPLGIVPQTVAALVQRGDIDGAYSYIAEKNPLPRVCAEICEEVCSGSCMRGRVIDEPLNIRALERYVAGRAGKAKRRYSRRFDEKRLTEALLGLSDMNIKLRQGGRGYEKLEEILVRLLA